MPKFDSFSLPPFPMAIVLVSVRYQLLIVKVFSSVVSSPNRVSPKVSIDADDDDYHCLANKRVSEQSVASRDQSPNAIKNTKPIPLWFPLNLPRAPFGDRFRLRGSLPPNPTMAALETLILYPPHTSVHALASIGIFAVVCCLIIRQRAAPCC